MIERIGWLDCSYGAAGDMLVAALVGAGVPVDVPKAAVAALGLPVRLDVVCANDNGLRVHRTLVSADETDPPRRTLADVERILGEAALGAPVRDLALAVFDRLARAEAAVHGTRVSEVHFHEVGALDALADIVACAAGFCELALSSVVVSPIALGSGRARTLHGVLPVPVPAVLQLLRDAALPVTSGSAPFEQCTPTGAAVLATVATAHGLLPDVTVTAVGVGVGTRRLPSGPSVVRLIVGTPSVLPHMGTAARDWQR